MLCHTREDSVKLEWFKQYGENLVSMPRQYPDVRFNDGNVTMVVALTNISQREEGLYRCNITNVKGEKNSANVSLFISDFTKKCYISHMLDQQQLSTVPRNFVRDRGPLANISTQDLNSEVNYEAMSSGGSDAKCLIVNTKHGDDVTLSMNVYKSTDDVDFYWLNPDDMRADCKSQVTVPAVQCKDQRKSDKVVIFKQVKLIDSGVYRFYCTTAQQDDEDIPPAVFCLDVRDRPRLSISLPTNYPFDAVLHSREQDIWCKFTANPRPRGVKWFICDGVSNDDECHSLLTTDLVEYQMYHYLARTTIDFNKYGSSSLNIKCTACNSVSCGESQLLQLYSVDYEPPYKKLLTYCASPQRNDLYVENRWAEVNENCSHVVARNDTHIKLYESQRVELRCGGPGPIDFDQGWQWRLEARGHEANMTEDEDVYITEDMVDLEANNTQIFRQETQHSHLHKLIIDPLTVENSGVYTCKGQRVTIHVLETNGPYRKPGEWNMDNDTLVLNVSASVVLECGASGSPAPSISWYKDDILIHHTSTSETLQSPRDLDPDYLQDHQIEVDGYKLYLSFFQQKNEGQYTCVRESLSGRITGFKTLNLEDEDQQLVKALVGGMGLLFVCFLLMLMSVVYYCNKHKVAREMLSQAEIELFLKGDPNSINYSLPTLQDQIYLLPYDSGLEFPRERLRLAKQIGCGAFGRIILGYATGVKPGQTETPVAVKTLKPQAGKTQLQALMSELKILAHIGQHPNVINLLGAITTNIHQRELFVILELCKFGNLLKFIQGNRGNFIDQINPETGKYDSKYPEDIDTRLSLSRGYNCRLNYVLLSFEQDHNALTRENVDQFNKRLEENTEYSTWDKGFIHKALQSKMSGVSTDSEFHETINTDTTMITNRPGNIDYSEVYPSNPPSTLANDSAMDPLIDNNYNQFGPLTTYHLLSWAYQVGKGMDYLSSKKIVHGDLAARNILLHEDGLVKITDFGLSKDVYNNPNYQKMSDGPLPIKWLSPETLNYRIFSVQSDVWSFGVVLWEMFSLGKSPYPGIDHDHSFASKIDGGLRMDQPEYATNELYKVMRDCWNHDPSLRPSFSELTEKIREEISDGNKEKYLRLGDIMDEPELNDDHVNQSAAAANSRRKSNIQEDVELDLLISQLNSRTTNKDDIACWDKDHISMKLATGDAPSRKPGPQRTAMMMDTTDRLGSFDPVVNLDEDRGEVSLALMDAAVPNSRARAVSNPEYQITQINQLLPQYYDSKLKGRSGVASTSRLTLMNGCTTWLKGKEKRTKLDPNSELLQVQRRPS